MSVEIAKINPVNIDNLSNGQIISFGSTSGRSISATIEMVNFFAEDSSWALVEWNRQDKADVENIGVNFAGEADIIILESTEHQKSFLGIKLNAKNTETNSIISTTVTIKD